MATTNSNATVDQSNGLATKSNGLEQNPLAFRTLEQIVGISGPNATGRKAPAPEPPPWTDSTDLVSKMRLIRRHSGHSFLMPRMRAMSPSTSTKKACDGLVPLCSGLRKWTRRNLRPSRWPIPQSLPSMTTILMTSFPTLRP